MCYKEFILENQANKKWHNQKNTKNVFSFVFYYSMPCPRRNVQDIWCCLVDGPSCPDNGFAPVGNLNLIKVQTTPPTFIQKLKKKQ